MHVLCILITEVLKELSEIVTSKCCVKKMFLKILQNSEVSICAGVDIYL